MSAVEQRPVEWLATASPEQVNAAFEAGELAELLGVEVPVTFAPGEQAAADDLARMNPGQVAAAYEAGQLDELLGRNQEGN